MNLTGEHDAEQERWNSAMSEKTVTMIRSLEDSLAHVLTVASSAPGGPPAGGS